LQKRIYAASRCGDIQRVRFPPENPNEVLVEQGISGKKGNTKQPGKTEFRPLSIPTIFDRALQAVVKATLEPEWEALQKYTELTH
jgi:hypothetical protein